MKVLELLVLLIPAVLGQSNGVWLPGRSTFYSPIDGGNCGYGMLPHTAPFIAPVSCDKYWRAPSVGTISSTQFPNLMIGAVDTPHWGGSESCGQCWQVQCLGSWPDAGSGCCIAGAGPVTIQITDQCPTSTNQQWCSGDVEHFDLSPNAFSAIADESCGVIKTQIMRVDCPVSGNVVINQDSGSNHHAHAHTLSH